MKRHRLTEDKDPMGRAIYEYFTTGKAGKLRVFSSQFDEDELPVKDLFRTLEQMPLRRLCSWHTGGYWMWEQGVDAIRLFCGRWGKKAWLLISRLGRWK